MDRRISRAILDRAIDSQGHRCGYCLLPFGTIVDTKHGTRVLKPNADHLIPFIAGGSSREANCVAACQLCNAIKGGRLFDDLLDARRYVEAHRKWTVDYIPDVALTDDAEEWSREYSAYLAS